MLRWANRKSLARWAHVRAGAVKEGGPLRGACVQSSVSPFASNADSHHNAHFEISPSKVSIRNSNSHYGDACAVRGQFAHGGFGHAEISVHKAGMPDVGDGDVKGSMCSPHGSKFQPVDDPTNSAACMRPTTTQASIGDVMETLSLKATNDDTIPVHAPELHDKYVPTDVTDASCTTRSPHMSLQSLVIPSQKDAQKELSDVRQKVKLLKNVANVSCTTPSPHGSLQAVLIQAQRDAQNELSNLQQKVKLLETEGFSVAHAEILVKRKAFKSCSYEQLATMLQVLKLSFASKVVQTILVRGSGILLEPVELVQQKIKLLHDYKFEEKVVCRLCCSGTVLSMSVEKLQKKLMFYEDIGLSVAARNAMFSRGPQILSLSIEKGIHPTLNFLESIGLTKDHILQFGQRCPEIFYMSLDNNVIKRYEYLSNLGCTAENFPRLFRHVSRISIKNIEERLQLLKDVGFSDDDVACMLAKQPAILGIASDNVKGKVKFLIHEQNRKMEEIVKHPTSLLYSLKGRMVPRFKILKKLGKCEAYSLSTILNYNDPRFIKWMERVQAKQLSAIS